jgi:hypothetical protein
MSDGNSYRAEESVGQMPIVGTIKIFEKNKNTNKK